MEREGSVYTNFLLYHVGERHCATPVASGVYNVCFLLSLKKTVFNILQVQITLVLLNVYTQLRPFFCIFHRELSGFPNKYPQHNEIIFSEIKVSPFHCPLGNSQCLSFAKQKEACQDQTGKLPVRKLQKLRG